jgi:hypothetical protein
MTKERTHRVLQRTVANLASLMAVWTHYELRFRSKISVLHPTCIPSALRHETNLGDNAGYATNSGGHTQPVGQRKPNDWGLYAVHGNIRQWVEDNWRDTYDGVARQVTANVLRGGSRCDDGSRRRSAARQKGRPASRAVVAWVPYWSINR